MNIKNCTKCKKIFSSLRGENICAECVKKEEEEFNIIREYLRVNRGANIDVVSEETGVSIKQIMKYLREGRLQATEGMSDFLKCEKCGVSIITGQFCKDCSEKMTKALKSIISTKPIENENSGPRMHLKRN